jgi:competence protein ComEA
MKALQNKSLLIQSDILIVIILVCSFLITYSFHSMATVSRLRHNAPDTIIFITDVNSAPSSELSILPGIGPELAEKIIIHRKEIGEFGDLYELKEVSGIGDKKIHQIRSHVYFGTIANP